MAIGLMNRWSISAVVMGVFGQDEEINLSMAVRLGASVF